MQSAWREVYLLLLLSAASLGVVVQQVVTRGPAVAGQAVQLECLWSRGSGPPLYSLRWCKDGDQFFVVTSVPEPRKVLFPVPGVQVLVGASDEHRVTLTNLTHAASGTYTCEAMSDGPAFFSSARSTRLAVLEVPAAGPTWRGLQSTYHLDQHLQAHCHVFASRPPALFTFLVNGLMITRQSEWHRWNPPIEQPQEFVWNSSSTLSVPLSLENIQKLFPQDEPKHTTHKALSLVSANGPRYQPESVWPSQYQEYRTTFVSSLQASHSHTQYRSASLLASRPTHTQGLSFPPNMLRLNLTCIAEVGELSFRSTAWSVVSLPTLVHPNGLTRSSGNAGFQHIPSLALCILLALYCLGRYVYIT